MLKPKLKKFKKKENSLDLWQLEDLHYTLLC